jgi:SAM-dependent methyltransferase
MNIPPIPDFTDHSFDCIISFQVIEHIKDDLSFLQEIKRILKKGGKALITTPNNKYTLTRNPWHQREYLSHELFQLASSVFDDVQIYGIKGNEKVMDYYYQNKKSVRKITRFDILDLQYRLPASWLRVPYDLLNRMNRRSLQREDDQLVASISHHDYLLTDSAQDGLDLFCVLTKS